MTFDELLAVAKRRGFVVWDKSRKVEYIFKGHGAQNICARNVLTGMVHPIYPRQTYYCRELTSSEYVKLGQLV